MSRETITISVESATRTAIDQIAADANRSVNELLTEAVEDFVAVRHWQLEHFKEGLRQAEAGEFATDAEMEETFARLTE